VDDWPGGESSETGAPPLLDWPRVKIYTKRGDQGETGLIDGSRVPKDDARVAAYGDVDELGAVLGLIRSHLYGSDLDRLLREVQRDLFVLGAQLADPTHLVASRKPKAALPAEKVEHLEREIDAREAALPPLTAFILAGGATVGALLHLARTVCRRAERAVVTLGRSHQTDPLILVYLNRLSDLLFVLARHENQKAGKPEDRW
jgi:cob(I)alamin adenosyltransferase